MDLDIARKLLRSYTDAHVTFVKDADAAERYFKKQNDIVFEKKKEDSDNPLRQADNRIPSNFYRLQVKQKAAYAFTVPPKFDTKDDTMNNVIRSELGDSFAKKCKALCIQAANNSVGWIHYWIGEDGKFHYAVIDSRQIIPVWTKNLEKELKAVLRTYTDIDENTGDNYFIYEIWTEMECQKFRRRTDLEWEYLEHYAAYPTVDIDSGITELTDTYRHGFGEVPFIFFNNNDEGLSDLKDIKELIDSYDKVFSGFINDLEDIQEIIFILTNYSGEADDTAEVLKQMKKKVITVESEGEGDKSGVDTLCIEIPVEARKTILDLTRKAIFEQGMAIDPDPQNFGNSSGVALQYLYSLLELKTGLMETEFRVSFNRLIHAILRFHNMTCENVMQTWKRTSVTNDAELAEICSKSKGVISDETIARNHPLVDDPEEEMKRLKEQQEAEKIDWDVVPTNPKESD